jgi:hypothetical protein
LRIREFAVLGRYAKNIETSSLKENSYTLLCEETYQNELIVHSISNGLKSLVKTLRTPNMFPIETTIKKIAESVIELYKVPENKLVELLFDDIELLSKEVGAV